MLVVRRNKGGVCETDADPVLAGAKFSRLFVRATHAMQQYRVGLAQHPVGQGHVAY